MRGAQRAAELTTLLPGVNHWLPASDTARALHTEKWTCPCRPSFRVLVPDSRRPDVQEVIVMHRDVG